MKYIKDYKDDGTVGIQCKSKEEWIKICDLLEIRDEAEMRRKYLEYDTYDTIGIYQNRQTGWGTTEAFKIILQASDFLEITYELY